MLDSIIIIPYRNRKAQLDIFIKETIPLFKKYLKTFKIVVIEQTEGKPFNRGKLINIGFKEFIHQAMFYFHHDVDIIPKENTVKFLYTIQNYDVLRLYCSHNESLGGIIKIKESAFININGFPNYIWGWGLEDRVLFYRSKIVKLNITDNLANKSNFIFLEHAASERPKDISERNNLDEFEKHIYNSVTFHEQLTYIRKFGLSDLSYEVIDRKKINDFVEILKVDV